MPWFTVRPAVNNDDDLLISGTAYLIELFPFAQRTHGISIEQLCSRISGTFCK